MGAMVSFKFIDFVKNVSTSVYRTDIGSLGVLQVTEEFLGKGLASILVKALSKHAVTTYNVDVTAHIYPTNIPSLNLFTKLGFREIHEKSKIELV